MKIFREIFNYLEGNDDWSFRSEAGVKLNVKERNGRVRVSVDFSDKKTREVARQRLEPYKNLKIEDGK